MILRKNIDSTKILAMLFIIENEKRHVDDEDA